jgi:hypothetical protein
VAARVAFAPSGLIVAGAGVGIGELAGLPWEATVSLAVFGWLVRLVGAVWTRWFRNLPLVTIDPIAVAEPWRSLVRDALGARQRFDQILAQWPSGPLHDRLVGASPAIHGATNEVWRVAKLGSSMAAPDMYAPEELSRRMRALQRRPSSVDPASAGFDEEAALAQQLQAIRRRQETTTQVEVQVRRLVTQLNVAVTDLAGLALGADAGRSAFETIDQLASELQSLHQAIGEIGAY